MIKFFEGLLKTLSTTNFSDHDMAMMSYYKTEFGPIEGNRLYKNYLTHRTML